jgi:hypothetical protein
MTPAETQAAFSEVRELPSGPWQVSGPWNHEQGYPQTWAVGTPDWTLAECPREDVARFIALAPDLARLVEELGGALEAALQELGVPGEGYPAPVANAVEILKVALASLAELGER